MQRNIGNRKDIVTPDSAQSLYRNQEDMAFVNSLEKNRLSLNWNWFQALLDCVYEIQRINFTGLNLQCDRIPPNSKLFSVIIFETYLTKD